jgi:hypothetical protein
MLLKNQINCAVDAAIFLPEPSFRGVEKHPKLSMHLQYKCHYISEAMHASNHTNGDYALH